MVGDLQSLKPKGAEAGQDASLVGNAVGKHPIEGADAIGRDQEQPIAEVVDVAHLSLSLGDRSGTEVRFQKCHDETINDYLVRLSSMSRAVFLRKSQLDGAAEIGPLMAKTAIW